MLQSSSTLTCRSARFPGHQDCDDDSVDISDGDSHDDGDYHDDNDGYDDVWCRALYISALEM